MLQFPGEKNARPESKIFTTFGAVPSYIDRSQTPTKKQPWRVINEVGFTRSVELVLPEELYDAVWRKLDAELLSVKYARVIMKLQDVLEGEFFTEYVKRGNILMLSEGQPGVDHVFSLRDGVLRLELDKEAYERAGLQGQPCRGGGRKHIKARYAVEINLRQPSMLHGKKGFERVVWAAKNVLNRSLTWLFYDIRDPRCGGLGDTSSPLSKHHPTLLNFQPVTRQDPDVRLPALRPPRDVTNSGAADVEEWTHDIVEWLGLVALGSGRIHSNDVIDHHLSRWDFATDTTHEPVKPIRIVRWEGMVDSGWITQLLVGCIFQSKTLPAHTVDGPWLAMTVQAHPTTAIGACDGYSVLLTSPPSAAAAAAAATSGLSRDGGKDFQGQVAGWGGNQSVEEEKEEEEDEGQQQQQQQQENGNGGKKPNGEKKRAGLLQDYACFRFVDCLGW